MINICVAGMRRNILVSGTEVHLHIELIFNKDARIIQWVRRQSFQHMGWEQLAIHLQNNELDPYIS